MYIGHNPCAIRSQRNISIALRNLMITQEYDKIHIKDVCKLAKITRQTFYQYFVTKDDVVRFDIHNNFHEMYEKLSGSEQQAEDIIGCLFEYVEKQSDYFKLLVERGLEYLITEELSRFYAKYTDRLYAFEDDKKRECAKAFLSGALSGLIIHWFKIGFSNNAAELKDIFFELINKKALAATE